MRRLPLLLTVSAVLLAACSGDDGPTDDVDLEAPATTDDDAADDGAADDVPVDEDVDDGPVDEGTDDVAPDGDDTADDGDGTDDDGAADGTQPPADLVDLREAVPGTWPVGDAGTVTFSVDGDALVLEDVSATDGWDADVDEEDADEIEVDFRRDDTRWEIEIELDDGTLEVEIRQDLLDAPPGSYDIGDAGTFAFDVDGDRLVLTDVTIEDDWTLDERDEDDDEFEIDLVDGPRRFDVEVELDDGRVEIEIDYTVTG